VHIDVGRYTTSHLDATFSHNVSHFQGLLTILEDKVELRCRQTDVSIVQKALPSAIATFKRIVKTVRLNTVLV